MTGGIVIETERLILREWRDEDVAAHNLVVNDQAFRAYLGPPMSMSDSAAAAGRMIASQRDYGSCFWVVKKRDSGAFAGYCGIKPGGPPIDGLPEIGWGIARSYWRRGYAHEAAAACLAWAWATRDWSSVYAITTVGNTPSWSLMERLGMTRLPDGDFDHPALAEDDRLRPHITYRIDRPR